MTDLDALSPDQMQTVFELYATRAIEARLCNDIGTKLVTAPADPHIAARNASAMASPTSTVPSS